MARLDRDILFEVARDLLLIRKRNMYEIVEAPDVAAFMLVNRDCKHAFLSQFSQAKSFVFADDESFELNQSGSENKLIYYGEYNREKWFMALLIQCGKFKPEDLVLTDVLKSETTKHELDLRGKTAMECLSILCKLNDGGLNLTNYAGPELRLKSFEVKANANLLIHLDKLLGVDALKVKLSASFKGYHCLPGTVNFSQVHPSRVECLELILDANDVNDEVFPTSEWIELLSYLVSSCPNLKSLHVRVVLSMKSCSGLDENSFDENSLDEEDISGSNLVCDCLHKAMKAMMDNVLPKILGNGCFISLEFNAHVFELEEIQSSGHELFRMGVQKPTENASDVCRVVSFDEHAELFFCISEFDEQSFMGSYGGDYNFSGHNSSGDSYSIYR